MGYITFSASEMQYLSKPTPSQFAFAKFNLITGTMKDLFDCTINGHITMYTFQDNKRNKQNFKQTRYIQLNYIGCDKTPHEAEQALRSHGLIPAFFYTTENNTPKNKCYRLVFLLKDTVKDVDEYKQVWKSLTQRIESITGLKADKRASDATHLYAGYTQTEGSSYHFNDDYVEIDTDTFTDTPTSMAV